MAELGEALYVFAGDRDEGNSMGEALRTALNAGFNAKEAFKRAAFDHGGIDAAIALVENREPLILASRAGNPPTLYEVEQFIDGGSLLDPAHARVRRAMAQLLQSHPERGDHLMFVVGAVQSLIYDGSELVDGVGGIVQGVGVGPGGVIRTPSCAYIMMDGTGRHVLQKVRGVFFRPGVALLHMVVYNAEKRRFESDFPLIVNDLHCSKADTVRVSDFGEVAFMATAYIAYLYVDDKSVALVKNGLCDGRVCKFGAEGGELILEMDTALDRFMGARKSAKENVTFVYEFQDGQFWHQAIVL